MKPKFRVWDKKRSKMFKVNAIRFKHPNGFEPTVLVDEGNGAESTLKLDDCILMQSIGLYDYRGVEVFEGDILTDEDSFILDCWKYRQVKFDEDDRLYYISWKIDYCSEQYEDIVNCSNYTIVGNIYDNKELLDEKFKFYNR